MELSLQKDQETVCDYIRLFADASKTGQHEVILECLDYHGLKNTGELTLEQAKEFWERRN